MARAARATYVFEVTEQGGFGWQPEVTDTLRAFGGEGTLGDVVTTTGLSRTEVEAALEALMRNEVVHVRVCESGHVVYRLDKPGRKVRARDAGRSARSRQVAFDRKTLRLIRCREGVLSMAELVEHTGLPLAEAEREMERLAEWYGGEPHPSWDGHVVWAFPEVMTSTHGRFETREPKPAWVRARDPLEGTRAGGPGRMGRWAGAVRRRLPWLDRRTLRRYALGYVVQAALTGKGVISLDRTVQYLRACGGSRIVRRGTVERALRQLAEEFGAPITEVEGELFFGFRNVKRQFLASQVVRKRMRLGSVASGRIVFDSGDSPSDSGKRDLESFDAELLQGPSRAEENHGALRPGE